MESTLTSKGQIAIPKAAREFLHLQPGDRVKLFYHPDGTLALPPKLPVSALKGSVPARAGMPVSLDAMDKAIRSRIHGFRKEDR